MRRIPITAVLSLTALFLLVGCVTQPQLKDVQGPPSYFSTIKQAPTIPFCDLIRDSTRYDKEIVRTHAVFFRNMENSYLFDPACGGENGYMWVEFDPAYINTDDALKKKLDDLLCPTQPCPIGRAQLTIVGRFEGPSTGPYGHLDSYHSRFSLIRVEQAEVARSFNP